MRVIFTVYKYRCNFSRELHRWAIQWTTTRFCILQSLQNNKRLWSNMYPHFLYFFHFLKLSILRQFSWNSEKVLRCMYFKHTAACRKWLEGIKETLLLVPFLLSQRWNVILRRKLLKIKYNLLILMQILQCKITFQFTCTIKRTPLHG